MKEEYLLVDGYNIIFCWSELKELANKSLDIARDKLINMLSNYQGVRQMNLILVFDAYKVEGGLGSIIKAGGIYVVYTKEAETADQYIERSTHKLVKDNKVTVATSDGLEQVIIMSKGALRMSANDLYEDVKLIANNIKEEISTYKSVKNNMLMDNLDKEAYDFLEELRRKKG